MSHLAQLMLSCLSLVSGHFVSLNQDFSQLTAHVSLGVILMVSSANLRTGRTKLAS